MNPKKGEVFIKIYEKIQAFDKKKDLTHQTAVVINKYDFPELIYRIDGDKEKKMSMQKGEQFNIIAPPCIYEHIKTTNWWCESPNQSAIE